MADHINKYAEFISKQQKELRGSTVNTVAGLNEETEAQAAKAYAKHAKMAAKGHSDLPIKVKGVDGFHHEDSDMLDQGYIIKHKSGKHSVTSIAHDEAKNIGDYEKESRKQNPHLSDKEHKEVAMAIHKAND